MSQQNPAQIEFDKFYIAPAEINTRFGVSPTMLRYMREKNQLPNSVKVGPMYIWVRTEAEPILQQWAMVKQIKDSVRK